MGHYINLFFSVYLHTFLLFCFLTILFWLIIRKTESDSINNEIVNSINSNLKNIHISDGIFTDSEGKYLKTLYEGKNLTVERNNNQLFMFNIVFIVLLLVGLLSSIFVRYMFCKQGFNWLEVIGENIIILIMVGAIEYFFFMNIASKYVPVKPSYLPSVVKSELEKL